MNADWIVHWPGKDVYMCDKHKEKAEEIASAIGFPLSVFPCLSDNIVCKNCENEAKNNEACTNKDTSNVD